MTKVNIIVAIRMYLHALISLQNPYAQLIAIYESNLTFNNLSVGIQTLLSTFIILLIITGNGIIDQHLFIWVRAIVWKTTFDYRIR